MINEWLTGKEFMRITNISESSLKRLKRITKKETPELLKLEDGKRKLHKNLLRKYSSKYFVDFHDLVNYQLRIGKRIDSINSIWGQYLIGMDWTLMGTLNYSQELPAKTCISRFKRKISSLKEVYPQIESFFATEKNKDREKGYHIHFFIKTPENMTEIVKKDLENKSFSSNKRENIKVEVYDSRKFGTSYFTKELNNNHDGYGFF